MTLYCITAVVVAARWPQLAPLELLLFAVHVHVHPVCAVLYHLSAIRYFTVLSTAAWATLLSRSGTAAYVLLWMHCMRLASPIAVHTEDIMCIPVILLLLLPLMRPLACSASTLALC
jgi:hypothetical protein